MNTTIMKGAIEPPSGDSRIKTTNALGVESFSGAAEAEIELVNQDPQLI